MSLSSVAIPLFAAATLTAAACDGLVIDNFAGGGGASTGIEQGLSLSRGRPVKVDKALNHSHTALAIHAANHPETEHFCQNIYQADPRDVTGGKHADWEHFSPDCKHYSIARGGKPKARNIRDLAWNIPHWAELTRPTVISMENVREFRQWRELDEGTGQPTEFTAPEQTFLCEALEKPKKKVPTRGPKAPDGATFTRWKNRMIKLGYKVEMRELRGCDYGDPTTRLRLFIIMRCDGRPIVWPEPTHGAPDSPEVLAGLREPYKTAASHVIDWSIPCESIFDRPSPLKENTLNRIRAGTFRFVINNPNPFVIPANDFDASRFAPFIDSQYGNSRGASATSPLPSVTAGGGGKQAIVTPFLVPLTHSGGPDRVIDTQKPMPTITGANRGEIALIAPVLIGAGGAEYAGKPRPADKPINALTTHSRAALVCAFLAQHNGGAIGHKADEPLSSITQSGAQQQVVTSHLVKLRNNCVGQPVTEPVDAIAAGGQHFGEVRCYSLKVSAFLCKYYGNDDHGQSVEEPVHAVTTKDRFGLVTVTLAGEEYVIVDIGMRMLTPRELARAQGWPEDYVLDPVCHYTTPSGKVKYGRLPKSYQVSAIGNGVNPGPMRALAAANDPRKPWPPQTGTPDEERAVA